MNCFFSLQLRGTDCKECILQSSYVKDVKWNFEECLQYSEEFIQPPAFEETVIIINDKRYLFSLRPSISALHTCMFCLLFSLYLAIYLSISISVCLTHTYTYMYVLSIFFFFFPPFFQSCLTPLLQTLIYFFPFLFFLSRNRRLYRVISQDRIQAIC